MNPKPLSSLNHFTVPVAISVPLRISALRNEEAAIRQQTSETRRTALVERSPDPDGPGKGDSAPSEGTASFHAKHRFSSKATISIARFYAMWPSSRRGSSLPDDLGDDSGLRYVDGMAGSGLLNGHACSSGHLALSLGRNHPI